MTVIRSFFPRITIRDGGKEEAWNAGVNGENDLLGVWVYRDIDNRAAVAAQELYERSFNIKAGLVAALPVCALLGTILWHFESALWFTLVPAFMAAFLLIPQLHPIQRRKELASHEIETQAAAQLYGAIEEAYRIHESTGMAGYAWLKGMTFGEIQDGMKRHKPLALRWVRRNRALLLKIRDA